jgi:hypothetical protein
MAGMLRWSLAIALALLLLVHVLCVPFYAGASVSPTLHWWLEHARLTVKRTPPRSMESFFIAINSEGLRLAPDYHYYAPGDWFVRLPLWLPITALALPTVFAWTGHTRRGRRAAREGCAKCSYARAGLAPGSPCPECGAPAAVKSAR